MMTNPKTSQIIVPIRIQKSVGVNIGGSLVFVLVYEVRF